MPRRAPVREYYEKDTYESDQYSKGNRRKRYIGDDNVYHRRNSLRDLDRELERERERDRDRDRLRSLTLPDFLPESSKRNKDDREIVSKTLDREDIEYIREPPRREREEILRRHSPRRESHTRREVDRQEILIREDKKGRRRSVEFDLEKDEFAARPRDRSLPTWDRQSKKSADKRSRRPLELDIEREDEIAVRRHNWSSMPLQDDNERDEIILRQMQKGRDSPDSEYERDEAVLRRNRTRDYERDMDRISPRSRSRVRIKNEREEITIKRGEREQRDDWVDLEREETIVRKQTDRPSSSPERIDNPGSPFRYEIVSPRRNSESPDYRPPESSFEEIEVRQRSESHGRSYENDIIINRHERESPAWRPRRRRRSPESSRKEEITWRRYHSDPEDADYEPGRIARRYVGLKEKRDRLWTEITKDLVVGEAIERSGYEYEETKHFYYVFAFLQYDDVASLVNLSEDIRRARRQRLVEIQKERASLPLLPPLPAPPLPLAPPRQLPLMLERPPIPAPRKEERHREHEVVIHEEERRRRR